MRKLNNKQKELIKLLPSEIRNDKSKSNMYKLVLAFIVLRYGMEKAKENGCIFASNDDILDEIQMKSKSDLTLAKRQLEADGLITMEKGHFSLVDSKATVYRLTEVMQTKMNAKQAAKQAEKGSKQVSEKQTETDTKQAVKQAVKQAEKQAVKGDFDERLSRIENLLSQIELFLGQINAKIDAIYTETGTKQAAKQATDTDTEVNISKGSLIKNLNKKENLYKPEVPVDKVPVSKEKINQKENEVSLSQVPGSKKKINSDKKKMEPSVLQALQNEGVADHSFSFKNFSSFEVPERTGASGHEVPSSLKENKETLSQVSGTSKESCKFERAEERHREVVLPQKLRIDAWSENPQIQEYEDAEGIVVTNLEEFEAEADWFEEDIRAKVTCDEWLTYLCTHFNNVREAWAEHFTSLPEVA